MSYIFLFATGFLISRLSVRYRLVELFFARIFQIRSDSFKQFLLYVLLASAFVSMFTPNFIAALTLLPVLNTLAKSFAQHHEPQVARRLTTMMVCTVMYGCNLGGMGSLVGSPANALMLGALELFKVENREKINFLSWFGWSLPLVLIMAGIAWALVVYLFVPKRQREEGIDIPEFHAGGEQPERVRRAWRAIGLWFGFWALHSILQIAAPVGGWSITLFNFEIGWNLWDKLAALFGVCYAALLFAPIFRAPNQQRQPLLRFSDCFNELPVRAFVFVAIILAISGLLIYLDVPEWLGSHLVQLIPQGLPPFAFYFSLCLITTMSTEALSNTAVAVVLFPLIHGLALSLDLNPLVAMMAIGLASTNAFMLPLGTPVNALLYGGVKNLSLATMATSGFMLNVISALWMAGFLEYVIPWYYGLDGSFSTIMFVVAEAVLKLGGVF